MKSIYSLTTFVLPYSSYSLFDQTKEMEGEQEQRLLIKDQTSEEESSLVTRVWNESKLMWIVAGPAIFTRFSTFGINVISQAFVGHIGPRELAAFALVFTVLIRFANGILVRFFRSIFFKVQNVKNRRKKSLKERGGP